MSVWQHATDYLMWSIIQVRLSADYADFTDRKFKEGFSTNYHNCADLFFSFCLISVICVICGYHLVKTAPIDGTDDVTTRVLYFSIYLRRASVSG